MPARWNRHTSSRPRSVASQERAGHSPWVVVAVSDAHVPRSICRTSLISGSKFSDSVNCPMSRTRPSPTMALPAAPNDGRQKQEDCHAQSFGVEANSCRLGSRGARASRGWRARSAASTSATFNITPSLSFAPSLAHVAAAPTCAMSCWWSKAPVTSVSGCWACKEPPGRRWLSKNWPTMKAIQMPSSSHTPQKVCPSRSLSSSVCPVAVFPLQRPCFSPKIYPHSTSLCYT